MSAELKDLRDFLFRGLMLESEAETFQSAGIQVGAESGRRRSASSPTPWLHSALSGAIEHLKWRACMRSCIASRTRYEP